jgi:flavin-dependent dehydrogenase
MTLRPVEIFGGGLAGLALGLGLRARGIPALIREAGSYPRHRVCGEFITALDSRTTSALKLDDILAGAVTARSMSWHEPGYNSMQHCLPEPALCLSRHRLDQAMAAAFVSAGGELETGHRAALENREGRIFACGRRPRASSRWIGLKQHFRDLDLEDDLELHLGNHAYVGLTRVEDGLVNVCGLFPRPESGQDASLCSRLRAVGLASLGERLEQASPVEGSACAVAGLDYENNGASGDSLGDHAGLIPPFTGNGMTIALQSAAIAAPCLESWSRGRSTWTETLLGLRNQLHRRFAKRLAIGRILHPWLLHPRRRFVIHRLHHLRLMPFGLLYRLCH